MHRERIICAGSVFVRLVRGRRPHSADSSPAGRVADCARHNHRCLRKCSVKAPAAADVGLSDAELSPLHKVRGPATGTARSETDARSSSPDFFGELPQKPKQETRVRSGLLWFKLEAERDPRLGLWSLGAVRAGSMLADVAVFRGVSLPLGTNTSGKNGILDSKIGGIGRMEAATLVRPCQELTAQVGPRARAPGSMASIVNLPCMLRAR